MPDRSHGDVGWRPGTRAVRRLQRVTRGDHAAWVGFAGLQQTVVERLLRQEAVEEPPVGRLADMRHIMGGGCAAGPEYEQAVARLARSIGSLDTHISRAGGAGSSLGITVRGALSSVEGTLAERQRQPLRNWEALRRVLAAHVPRPMWFPPEDTDQVGALTTALLRSWPAVIDAAADVRAEWAKASLVEVTRRARISKRSGLLQLILRSWREWVDDTRAGAAKWEVRWQQSSQHGRMHRLAHRIDVRGDTWLQPAAVMTRRLLEYMRLVRAPHVHAQRRASAQWQAAERQRLADMAAAAAPPQQAAAAATIGRAASARARLRIREMAPTIRKRAHTADTRVRPRTRRHDGQLWYTPAAADKLGLWIGGDLGGWPEILVDDGG